MRRNSLLRRMFYSKCGNLSTLLMKYRKILRLGLPILVGQIGNIVLGFADNIMVGRYSTDALASASFVNNIFNIALFCCMGFSMGLTPLIGALFARKEQERIGAMVRKGLWINIIFTLIICGVMLALYFNIHCLGQPVHLLPIIRPYFLIFLAGMLPMTVFNVFAQWSYAINNTKLPMIIILCANCINILGNYALIYGHFGLPEMGLTGAGISTFISRVIGPLAIMAVFFMKKEYKVYASSFSNVSISHRDGVKIVRTGFPVAMQMSFETSAFSGAAIMAGWLGAVELASFQIVVIIGMLGFGIYYSFGSATSVLVSHAAGQNDNRDMRRTAWAGYHVILAIMTVSCLIFIFLGRNLMSIFTNDPAVIAMGSTLIFPLVLYQIADATQINFANALRGTSHVMPMLYIAFVSYIIVGLPSTYLIAFTWGMGLYGIILSFSVSLIVAAVLFFIYFMRATRK